MTDLIESLLGPLVPYAQAALPYVAYILAVALVLAVIVRFALAWVIRLIARKRSRMSKDHFKVKSELLAHNRICELYAPAQRYTRERREKEAQREQAWLSPFPRAVRASMKHAALSSSNKLEARKQIAEAAKHINVRPLPSSVHVAGEPDEHYRIDFKLDGHDTDELKRFEGRIAAQLGLHSLEPLETEDNYSISYIAHKTAPVDILTEHAAGVEFFEENPAKVPYSLPLAVQGDGRPWSLATHHTLIYGMTGSGKGSPIHGLVRQLSPYVSNGRAKLYGIDPKASELRPYMESSLFEDVVAENDEAQEVIGQLHHMMKERSRTKTVDLKNAQLGRSLEATRETPMIVLVIDEMLSLLIALKGLGKPGVATMTLLTEILAQGRSLNVFVVGATQAVDTELLGRMRVNFANTILLRQESAYYNDLFLGERAKERGYDSTSIPLSSKANGYAYAGIGYVKGDTGAPIKVRFAYTSDEDLAALIQEFPKHETSDFDDFDTTTDEPEKDEEAPKQVSALPDVDDLDAFGDFNNHEEANA